MKAALRQYDMVKGILLGQRLIPSTTMRKPGAASWPKMVPLLDALLAEYDLAGC
jgi:hypothetical protein